MQSVFISLMLVIMSSFFVTMNLLSVQSYGKIQSSITDIKIIYNRLQCAMNLVNTYTEVYTKQDKLGYFSQLDDQIELCLDLEGKYL